MKMFCKLKTNKSELQILSTRARKNVDTSGIKVEVCIYAFDILYVNGKALLKEQLETRRQVF